jgi:hypothetical protein
MLLGPAPEGCTVRGRGSICGSSGIGDTSRGCRIGLIGNLDRHGGVGWIGRRSERRARLGC